LLFLLFLLPAEIYTQDTCNKDNPFGLEDYDTVSYTALMKRRGLTPEPPTPLLTLPMMVHQLEVTSLFKAKYVYNYNDTFLGMSSV